MTKPLHLMSADELEYEFFKSTGVKPPSLKASQAERDDYIKVVHLHLKNLGKELERRRLTKHSSTASQ